MHKQTSHYGWESANGQIGLCLVPKRGRGKSAAFSDPVRLPTAPPKTNTRIAIICGNVLWEYAASLEVIRAPEWGKKGTDRFG